VNVRVFLGDPHLDSVAGQRSLDDTAATPGDDPGSPCDTSADLP
jgi:hypothetical protein